MLTFDPMTAAYDGDRRHAHLGTAWELCHAASKLSRADLRVNAEARRGAALTGWMWLTPAESRSRAENEAREIGPPPNRSAARRAPTTAAKGGSLSVAASGSQIRGRL